MKIYKSEINDGLGDLLKNNSIACCAVAEKHNTDISSEDVSKLRKILAEKAVDSDVAIAQNEDQIDLYYLKSILVSTGWNKNDDVFDPKELWSAKDTPEDKPFNFMHDEKDIIGHITGNIVVDFDGQEINLESDEAPTTFNILTTSVIYTEWSDQDQRNRMQKIVSEIEDGKWFVSMECLFPDFDYALADSDGSIKVVPRSEASAFLTKHLRSYGGSGKYQDYRVGRLLRNLSFSGKGLVSKPANPRSVILDGNEFFDESKAEILTISSIKEHTMNENHEQKIADLQKELAEAKTANEALKDAVVAEQHELFAANIKELEATIAEQAEANEALTKTLDEKEQQIVAGSDEFKNIVAEVKAKDEELAVMKQKETAMQRKSKLEELGFDTEDAVATVEELDSIDEDTFDKLVAIMKKKAEWPPKKKDEDKEKEEDTKAAPAAQAEVDEETDSAEASVDVLEDAEESADVAIAEAVGEDDPAESLRATASEWLGSILQSVPNEDK
tara:strand:+ start:151 stop:1656 length:1506 start_codon:yes stop_codon:yes gene_type:complete